MILDNIKINVEKSPGIKESTFTIKASPKAFKILSDGLYSDKIKAILKHIR